MTTNFLPQKMLTSIYFGGGTPSILDASELLQILNALREHYIWDDTAEVTLEANPDDLNLDKIKELHDIGINRLSVGIQSFHDEDLTYMNRAHNADEAISVLEDIKRFDFKSITCDLIYGSPTTTDAMLIDNINRLIDAGIPHISAYSLTVEEGTALHHMIKKKKTTPPMDETSTRQFEILMNQLGLHGYEHYEISNYALKGHHAIHNKSYWNQQPYLGIGPSAHSYNGFRTRRWNIAHNPKYIKAIEQNDLPFSEETLSEKDIYNEYILTKIRTSEGLNIDYIREKFNVYLPIFLKQVEKEIADKNVTLGRHGYALTQKGKFIADNVSMGFFIVD